MNHPKENRVKKYLPPIVGYATLIAGALLTAKVSEQLRDLTGRKWG